MRVQVPQRPLEGVLLALLVAVAAHQLGKRQVVLGDEDDGVDGEELPLGAFEELAHHDAGVLRPAVRLVARQHGMFAQAGVCEILFDFQRAWKQSAYWRTCGVFF